MFDVYILEYITQQFRKWVLLCISLRKGTQTRRNHRHISTTFLFLVIFLEFFLFKNIYFLFYLTVLCKSAKLYMYHKRVFKGQKRALHTLKLKMVISYPIDVRTQTQGPLPVHQVLLTTKLPLRSFFSTSFPLVYNHSKCPQSVGSNSTFSP